MALQTKLNHETEQQSKTSFKPALFPFLINYDIILL